MCVCEHGNAKAQQAREIEFGICTLIKAVDLYQILDHIRQPYVYLSVCLCVFCEHDIVSKTLRARGIKLAT